MIEVQDYELPTMNCYHFLATACLCGSAFLVNPARGQVLFEFEDLELIESDRGPFHGYGYSIDIDNGIVAVGANAATMNSNAVAGAAYLFDAESGAELFRLVPDVPVDNDHFGNSIAIGNGIVAVGADWGPGPGCVYLFDASTGQQTNKIISEPASAWDRFGWSLVIHDGVLVVGSRWSGSTFLFDLTTGEQIGMLDVGSWAMDMDDGVLAIGHTSPHGGQQGSASLYDVESLTLLHRVRPINEPNFINFGTDVAIENGTLVVGAWGEDDNKLDSGSAYIFDVKSGEQIARLLASDGRHADRFGHAVAIDDGMIAIGSVQHYNGFITDTRSGSVYLFDASTGTELIQLLPSDGKDWDWMGWSVAMDNGKVAVGAPRTDDLGSTTGSAYVFDITCPVDFNNDSILDFFDISEFLQSFIANEPIADFNNDNLWNFFDVSAFLQAFNTGCP